MAGDGTNKVDTAQLAKTASDIGNIKKSIANNVDGVDAVLRKLRDSWTGESADDIAAVTKQLQASSTSIVSTLAKYETTLNELAGIYNTSEKKVVSSAGKLKFGGMK